MEHVDLDELRRTGFCIVRRVVGIDACRAACALIDDHLGPPGKSVEQYVNSKGWELSKQYNGNPRPPPDADCEWWAAAPPFLQSNNYRHDIRHPIRDGPTMAGLITKEQVQVHTLALGCRAQEDLKLMQQFLVRTDYQPPPYPEHPGWHMDHATLPWQQEFSPSQHYYASLIALDDIPTGLAPFIVADDSLRRLRAKTERYTANEPEWCARLQDLEFHTTLRDRLRSELSEETAPADEKPIEVLLRAGDMAVIDPMCLHAASPCKLPGRSRYVCINTFFDASAAGHVCRPVRGSTEPAGKYPPVLRQALVPQLRSLLDWTVPRETDSQARLLRSATSLRTCKL